MAAIFNDPKMSAKILKFKNMTAGPEEQCKLQTNRQTSFYSCVHVNKKDHLAANIQQYLLKATGFK